MTESEAQLATQRIAQQMLDHAHCSECDAPLTQAIVRVKWMHDQHFHCAYICGVCCRARWAHFDMNDEIRREMGFEVEPSQSIPSAFRTIFS